MRRSDFSYELPDALIAQQPLPRRSASRLLCLDGATGAVVDRHFFDLPGLLDAGDLLVLNDTRVVPARLYGRKTTGGRVEILVERVETPTVAVVKLRASKTPATGSVVDLDGGASATIAGRDDDLYRLEFDTPVHEVMARDGHVPLPPYIRRDDGPDDLRRYQTVYARAPGAVAAPTAGLHFDTALFDALDARGVRRTTVTLHVGAGTFQPVRVDDLDRHRMHSERVVVPPEACAAVAATRAAGRRVIAVGTTSVRSLEAAAARTGNVEPFDGETDLFIRPGFRFRAVDAMITNFHLPESTLLMLVSAFAGTDCILAAYRHAVAEQYRFFSYGDAMFVTPA